MTADYLELGNVLTRLVRVSDPELWPRQGFSPTQHATPTTTYEPWGAPERGIEQLLAAAAGLGSLHGADGAPPTERPTRAGGGDRVALVHLRGTPQTCVVGLAGLATTELTIQAALRQAGSNVAQIKSSDAADLEAQLIDVRARPLDLLVFTGPVVSTARRLVSGGGPAPRVLDSLQALYNGPVGEDAELAEVLSAVTNLQVLAPIRIDTQTLDPEPTERALAQATDKVLAADAELGILHNAGFAVHTFARAFTAAAESLAAWRRRLPTPEGPHAVGGLALIDLGGRFTEIAVVAESRASRSVDDLAQRDLMIGDAPAAGRSGPAATPPPHALLVSDIGRWLPFDWSPTGLGDHLANYLRRPFVLPATWAQLLIAMALGRQRLSRTCAGFRMASGTANWSGDWRRHVAAYVISGGYVRHLPGPAFALALAIDGIEPMGVSEIWCDRWGLSPYLAVSGRKAEPDPALYLRRLATVVAPVALRLDWRRPHEDDIMALVTVERQGGQATSFRIVPGSLMRFPLRPGEEAVLTVHPQREHDFGAGPGKAWRGRVTGGDLGLIFDTRGRPIAMPPEDLIRQAKLREWLNTLGTGVRWEDGSA